jgi:hypothetical protein
MDLDKQEKLSLLYKAIEIAKQAAGPASSPVVLADVIQKTYDKIFEIANKM